MMRQLLLNLLIVNSLWFVCVLGGAHGLGWVAFAIVVLWLVLHAMLQTPAVVTRELRFCLAVGALGWCLDTVLGLVGAVGYTHWSFAPWSGQPFMVALWINFATSIGLAFAWLAGRPVLAAVVGGVCGPVAYYSGVRLGALLIPSPMAWRLAAIGVAWAIAMPVILWLHGRLLGTGTTISSTGDSDTARPSLPLPPPAPSSPSLPPPSPSAKPIAVSTAEGRP